MKSQLRPAIVLFLVLTLMTGVAYPLANGKVTNLGGGAYGVDVSDLARGRYTFTPVIGGTAAAYRQGFEVHGSQNAAARPVVQEGSSFIDIGPLSATSSTSAAVDLKWSSLAQKR